jgi:nitrate reductase gamma subunit
MVGSVCFHVGILFLLVGHTVGLLCFVCPTLLLHRRLFDARIRATSSVADIAILVLLWVQLVLGLATIPVSLGHLDGSVMVQLSHWAQGIVTFRADAASHLEGVGFIFKAHIFLGLTLFVAFPFSRLVHIWSAPIGYAMRPYRLVRRRGRNARVA